MKPYSLRPRLKYSQGSQKVRKSNDIMNIIYVTIKFSLESDCKKKLTENECRIFQSKIDF